MPCEIGGGFGGKIAVYLEPVAALLSRKCGRPVKMTMNRDEVFEGTGPTPGSFMRVKLGATKDGKLVAGEAWLAYDAGAYPGGMIGPGCMCVFSCYEIPNARVDGYDVLRQQAQDAGLSRPGATQAAFACESVIDELAEKLEHRPDRVPPEERRQGRDAPRRRPGLSARSASSKRWKRPRTATHWKTPLDGPESRPRHRQRLLVQHRARSRAAAANVNADGTVTLVEGSTDIGGTRTSIAMQLAETLGIAAEDVKPQRRRHRQRRLHRRHRRQPRDVRHRPGRVRGRARHPASR